MMWNPQLEQHLEQFNDDDESDKVDAKNVPQLQAVVHDELVEGDDGILLPSSPLTTTKNNNNNNNILKTRHHPSQASDPHMAEKNNKNSSEMLVTWRHCELLLLVLLTILGLLQLIDLDARNSRGGDNHTFLFFAFTSSFFWQRILLSIYLLMVWALWYRSTPSAAVTNDDDDRAHKRHPWLTSSAPTTTTPTTALNHDEGHPPENKPLGTNTTTSDDCGRLEILSLLGELGAPLPPPLFLVHFSEASPKPAKREEEEGDKEKELYATTKLLSNGGSNGIFNDKTCEPATTISQSLVLAPLEHYLRECVALVHVVDLALEDLQVVTRLQLGLGWKQPPPSTMGSVDRAERAYVGRWLRRKHCQQPRQGRQSNSDDDHQIDNGSANDRKGSNRSTPANTTGGVVSLSILRKRLYQLLVQQCQCLALLENIWKLDRGVIDVLNDGNLMEVGGDSNKNNDNDEEEYPILTLTVLRAQKDELIHRLSSLASLVLEYDDACRHCSSKERLDNRWVDGGRALDDAATAVSESRTYLQHFLGIADAPPQDQGDEPQQVQTTTTIPPRLLAVRSVLEQLYGLNIAARALEDEEEKLSHEAHCNGPEFTASMEWWKRLQSMTHQLESMVDQVTADHFDDKGNNDMAEHSGTDAEDPSLHRRSKQENGEYSAVEEKDSASPTPRPRLDEKYKSKTLVFLVGSNHRREDHPGRSKRRRKRANQVGQVDDQQLLLEELENRLGSLPQVEEITVVLRQEGEEDDDDYKDNGGSDKEDNDNYDDRQNNHQVKQETSADSPSALMAMPADSEHARLFQGELAASLANLVQPFSQDDDDDDDENKNDKDGTENENENEKALVSDHDENNVENENGHAHEHGVWFDIF